MNRHNTRKHLNKTKFPLHRLYTAVLLLLVMATGTFTWTSGTLAKYVSSVSVSDSAEVAAFVVEASGQTNQTLTIGATEESVSYSFTVSNKKVTAVSEVSTTYDVTVKFPSAVSGVSLALKKGTTEIKGKTTDNKTYIFENAGSFQPGKSQTDNLTLTFNRESNNQNLAWTGITITVNAEQQD